VEQLAQCPCCKSEKLVPHGKLKDYYVSKQSFTLSKCSDCGFVFTNPRPDMQEIGKYYQSDAYMSHHSSNTSLFHRLYRAIRNYMYNKKMSYIKQHLTESLKNSALLDYGAASGDFLAYCATQHIKQLAGVEQDAGCREAALMQYGIALKAVPELATLEKESFNVITLWHVLEHVHNVDEVVSTFFQLLKDKGLLVVSVPNINSLDWCIYGDYWSAYDVPRHIYHFNTSTITVLMKRLGFTLEKTYPLPFDAYYISLHSEWYMQSNKLMAVLRAIKNGFLSNWDAHKTGEYSSLVYIFRKV